MRILCCRTHQDLIVLASVLILLAYCDLVRRLVVVYVRKVHESPMAFGEEEASE